MGARQRPIRLRREAAAPMPRRLPISSACAVGHNRPHARWRTQDKFGEDFCATMTGPVTKVCEGVMNKETFQRKRGEGDVHKNIKS